MVVGIGIEIGNVDSGIFTGQFPDIWPADYLCISLADTIARRRFASLQSMALAGICFFLWILASLPVLPQLRGFCGSQYTIWVVFEPQDMGLDGFFDVSFILLSRKRTEGV